jgi:hypothetical protein
MSAQVSCFRLPIVAIVLALGVGCATGGKIPADQCERACGGPERLALAELQCERLEEEVDTCKLGAAVAWQICRASCEEPE